MTKSGKKRSRNLKEEESKNSNFKLFEYKKENRFSKKKFEIKVSDEEEDEDGIVYLDNTELEVDDEFEADFSFIKKQKKNCNTSIEEIL